MGEVGEDFREGGSSLEGDFCFYFFFAEVSLCAVGEELGGVSREIVYAYDEIAGKLDCPSNNPNIQGLEKEEIKAAIKEGETKQKEIKDEIKELDKERKEILSG
ncbi:3772_t:CDS:2, partial [Racocetra persica]